MCVCWLRLVCHNDSNPSKMGSKSPNNNRGETKQRPTDINNGTSVRKADRKSRRREKNIWIDSLCSKLNGRSASQLYGRQRKKNYIGMALIWLCLRICSMSLQNLPIFMSWFILRYAKAIMVEVKKRGKELLIEKNESTYFMSIYNSKCSINDTQKHRISTPVTKPNLLFYIFLHLVLLLVVVVFRLFFNRPRHSLRLFCY